MSIRNWWQKLNSPPRTSYDHEFYKKMAIKEDEKVKEGKGSQTMVDHYIHSVVRNLETENKFLRRMMQYYFANRKVVSPAEVGDQLNNFSKACEALAHNKLLGVSRESEMSKIVEAAWANEKAKLLYLMFDETNVQMEVVEQKIAEYKKEMQDDAGTAPQGS